MWPGPHAVVRELIRADLPELLGLSERMRSFVRRSSTAFALLAGIGAALIFGELVRAVSSAMLEIARPEQAPRPYDLQQVLAPAAGLVVARAAGGIPGALAYLGYSGVALVLGWLSRALTCARVLRSGDLGLGLSSFCSFGPPDLLAGAAPTLIGLGVGAVVARYLGSSGRPGANPLLEAGGAHTLPTLVFAFGASAIAVPQESLLPQAVAIAALTVSAGVLAGVTAGIRSVTPMRTAFILVVLLLAPWACTLGVSQFLMAAGSDRPEVYLFAVPLLDVPTIPLAAWVVARRMAGRRP